jgi:hypothetical protein
LSVAFINWWANLTGFRTFAFFFADIHEADSRRSNFVDALQEDLAKMPNWSRTSGLQSTLAPTSQSRAFSAFPDLDQCADRGTHDASILPSPMTEATNMAPVLPALTNPSSVFCLTMPMPTLIEDRGLDATAFGGGFLHADHLIGMHNRKGLGVVTPGLKF